jgi:hypothetical protein
MNKLHTFTSVVTNKLGTPTFGWHYCMGMCTSIWENAANASALFFWAHAWLSVMQTAHSVRMYSVYSENVKNMEAVMHLYLNTAVTVLLFLYVAVSINSLEARRSSTKETGEHCQAGRSARSVFSWGNQSSINLAVTGNRAVLLIAARRKPSSETKHVSCHFYHIIFSSLNYV